MPRHSKDTVAVLGIDVGKNTFHLVGLKKRGAIVLRLKLSRTQLEAKLANLPPCLVGMEACVGAHHLSRRLETLGHDPRLMPAKYAKAFLKGNKNDFRDAEAIAEAVQRPTMRFVATKTAEQLDLQALTPGALTPGQRADGDCQRDPRFSARSWCGGDPRSAPAACRTAGHPRHAHRRAIAAPTAHHRGLVADWRRLDERIDAVSLEIEMLANQDTGCERLMTVPGIGPIISSAPVAAIGTGDVFSKGRDFGAWLGLVPKQISTGDRTILGKISKRGNKYLRSLFVQAARVVLLRPASWECYGLKPWIEAAAKRLHHNVLAIAVANKLARIAWSVLHHGRNFEVRKMPEPTSQPA